MTSVKRDILERVAEKFKAHLEAKKNPIMAAVKFDRRRQLQGETFDSFVTDLRLLARGLEMTETNKLIRKVIACKLLDEGVRQRCLEKSKNLTLETAISIGRMFEATRDGLQVMSVEDPRIEVSKVKWKKDSSRQHKKARNFKKPKGNNEQAQKCDRRETSRNRKVTMSRLRNVTGVDTMHTSHKKSVQPRMNRVISAGN